MGAALVLVCGLLVCVVGWLLIDPVKMMDLVVFAFLQQLLCVMKK